MARVIVMVDCSLGADKIDGASWLACRQLADSLGEAVLLATIDHEWLPVGEFVFPPSLVSHGEIVRPGQGRSHHAG